MTGKEYLAYNKRKAREYPLLCKKGFANKLLFNSGLIDSYSIISIPKKHVFVGYYDLLNINKAGDMFFLAINQNASPKRNSAEIYLYNVLTKKIERITKTRAWNFQQGSRMTWLDETHIGFNDFDNSYHYASVDILTKEKTVFCKYPLYDFSLKSGYGISINFERLQSLRPGYGYSSANEALTEFAPKDDGLFLIDLKTQTKQLIYSYYDLRNEVLENTTEKDYHYINHVKFSPNGERVMFFHLWTKDNLDMWKTRVIVYDLTSKSKIVLEDNAIASHYTWINNDKIMLTLLKNNEPCYYLYEISTGRKTYIDDMSLSNDGHMTFFANKNIFVSDTYPLDNSLQHLFIYDLKQKKRNELVTIFSDPRMYIEKRCDLHPRLDEYHSIINIDTTYSERLRKIVVLLYNKEKIDE